MRRQRSLFKYYAERRWAEAFLDGELLFRSLAYFRDYEDGRIRGDRNEGRALYKPQDGLVAKNLTQGTTVTLPAHAFTSTAKQGEIFVFCLSRALTEKMRRGFNATVAVEIRDISAFCARIEAALPAEASLP